MIFIIRRNEEVWKEKKQISGGIIKKHLTSLQPWTLIRGHKRNMAKKCFSANVSKVLIFGLLFRSGAINDFSYQDWVLGCY